MPGEAQFVAPIVVGIGATLLVVAWSVVLRMAFDIRSLDYCLLGRWLRHMPATMRHENIAHAPARRHECATGWLAHYAIGVSLTIAFVLVSDGWLARPTLMPALSWGVATVIFPLLVMQPALGFGVASSRTRFPARARVKSLLTHVVFGCGIYAVARLLAALA